MNRQGIVLFVIITTFTSYTLYSYAPTHLSRPYEIPTFLYEKHKQTMNAGFFIEGGSSSIGGNSDGHHVNFLQRYHTAEATVPMLKSRISLEEDAKQLLQTINTDKLTENDGTISFNGTYDQLNFTTWYTWKLPIENAYGSFAFTTYLPFTYQAIRNVQISDNTPLTAIGNSALVKQLITNNLDSFIQKYGSDLQIKNQNQTYGGLGDIVCTLQWQKNFPQYKEQLKNVLVHAHLGTSIPTGIKRDVNNPFHVENGNNGAWGLLLKAGLDLGFIYDFHCGIDVDFLTLFFTTNTFRLKTDPLQTSFLIPEKGIATLAQGNSWNFGLWSGFKRICKTGFYGGFKYQFMTHNEDELYPLANDFDFNVVNSNAQLDEWSAHYLMFHAGYSSEHQKNDRITCNISLFYKAPVLYKRSILMHTLGTQLILKF